MRIFIAGGGQTAEFIAKRLIAEGMELVIVELEEERCKYLEAHLDARVCHGDATSPATWERAGIDASDMLIAVTPSDATNVITCMTVGAVAPQGVKAIQMRTWEYQKWERILRDNNVRIDLVIHPETVVVARILRVLMLPGVSDVRDFAGGRVKAFGMNVERGSWLERQSIAQLDRKGPPPDSMIAMIQRASEARIPRADDVLQAGDHIYVVTTDERLDDTMRFMGIEKREAVHQVFIVGGGELGAALASALEERHIDVKIFEQDPHQAELLSGMLEKSVVIQADGTDQETLEQENVHGVDAFVALTKDDHANLLTCLLARRLGAGKLVPLLNRVHNLSLAQRLGINTTVSTRMKSVDHILRFVRPGGIQSVRTFGGVEGEAMELVVPEKSRYTGRSLDKVHFPHGVVVAAIVKPGDRVSIPRGDAVIEAGDRVVLFAEEGCIHRLESDFLESGRWL